MARVDLLLDTNVLIRAWRGDKTLTSEILKFNAGIDTVVKLEFLQGANKRQFAKAVAFADAFEFIPFLPEVSFKAEALIKDFAHTKGLRIGDALIASTALTLDLPLYTFNKKHFNFIKGLRLI